MNNLNCIKKRIRSTIAGSSVPEDPEHAENTLQWLLKLKPDADEALRIAALGHDIERAIEDRKVRREDFADYDAFKAAHAENSAVIFREIMKSCEVSDPDLIDEVCRLVLLHEVGGDPRAKLLQHADSLSFFEVNLPLYLKREGWEESRRRAIWSYKRLSEKERTIVRSFSYQNERINSLLKEIVKICDKGIQQRIGDG